MKDYRQTGCPWFGEIPAHWDFVRLGTVLRERGEVNSGYKTQNVLSVLKDVGVINYEDKGDIGNKKSEDIERYKIVHTGDLVLNSMNVIIGSVGLAKEDGALSPVYIVLKAADKTVRMPYYGYVFQSRPFQRSLKRIGYGILEHRLRIPFAQLKIESLPKPPPAEQDAIVSFLEAKERDMAAFIANKRRMIELLQEHLSARIETLLDRPGDSHLVKLGYYVDLLPGFAFASERFTTNERDIRLLRGINVAPGQIRWDETVRYPMSERASYQEYELCPGDLVLGMDRPWIADGVRVAEIRESDTPCLLLQRVARLRAQQGLRQAYLKLLLCSRAFQKYFEPILTGISVPHISPGQILGFRFSPPAVEEQDRVVKEIERERKEMSSAIAAAEREIELMEEYRTALIAAAVTGKIDVRNAGEGRTP